MAVGARRACFRCSGARLGQGGTTSRRMRKRGDVVESTCTKALAPCLVVFDASAGVPLAD